LRSATRDCSCSQRYAMSSWWLPLHRFLPSKLVPKHIFLVVVHGTALWTSTDIACGPLLHTTHYVNNANGIDDASNNTGPTLEYTTLHTVFSVFNTIFVMINMFMYAITNRSHVHIRLCLKIPKYLTKLRYWLIMIKKTIQNFFRGFVHGKYSVLDVIAAMWGLEGAITSRLHFGVDGYGLVHPMDALLRLEFNNDAHCL
jgi:hypothetical protein